MTDAARKAVALADSSPDLLTRYAASLEWSVDEYSSLIPADELPAVRRALMLWCAPASRHRTGKAVAILLGNFKVGNVIDDPDIFVDGMIAELSAYPVDVLDAAISQARRRFEWVPSISQMVEICDGLVKDRRRHLRNVDRMEKEHQRRQREADRAAEQERSQQAEIDRIEALVATVDNPPLSHSFRVARQVMRFGRGGDIRRRFHLAAEWEDAVKRLEPWAVQTYRLAVLVGQATRNAISESKRMALLQEALTDEARARELFDDASATADTDGDCSDLRRDRHGDPILAGDLQQLVDELLNRSRIDGTRESDAEFRRMLDAEYRTRGE